MSMLDEYVKITRTIENIQTKINRYIKDIEEAIENAQTEREKDEKINELKDMMHRIKNDRDITQKYRYLKERQKELRGQLTLSTQSHVVVINPEPNSFDVLVDLRERYDKLAKQEIVLTDDEFDQMEYNTHESIQNIKFDILLQEVQKNLKS